MIDALCLHYHLCRTVLSECQKQTNQCSHHHQQNNHPNDNKSTKAVKIEKYDARAARANFHKKSPKIRNIGQNVEKNENHQFFSKLTKIGRNLKRLVHEQLVHQIINNWSMMRPRGAGTIIQGFGIMGPHPPRRCSPEVPGGSLGTLPRRSPEVLNTTFNYSFFFPGGPRRLAGHISPEVPRRLLHVPAGFQVAALRRQGPPRPANPKIVQNPIFSSKFNIFMIFHIFQKKHDKF